MTHSLTIFSRLIYTVRELIEGHLMHDLFAQLKSLAIWTSAKHTSSCDCDIWLLELKAFIWHLRMFSFHLGLNAISEISHFIAVNQVNLGKLQGMPVSDWWFDRTHSILAQSILGTIKNNHTWFDSSCLHEADQLSSIQKCHSVIAFVFLLYFRWKKNQLIYFILLLRSYN